MRYLSLFSGIDAVSQAWLPLGWTPVAFAEIEKFPCAVLEHRYPGVPNLGDITKLSREVLEGLGPVDLVVAGAPCQAFSVAGLRKGLADPRGNLTLELLRVVDAVRPRWLVYENVPGIRSAVSHHAPEPVPPGDPVDVGSPHEVVVEDDYEVEESHALCCFLAGLRELGYLGCLRSLDARYFGLAQRRERVFVVAHPRDWRPAAAVLLEREGLSGDPPPRREAGPGVARSLDTGAGGSSAKEQQRTSVGADGSPLNPLGPTVMSSGQANAEITHDEAPTLNCLHEAPVVVPPLTASFGKHYGQDDQHIDGGGQHFVTEPQVFTKSRRAQSEEDDETWVPGEVAPTLNAFDQGDVRTTAAVVQPIPIALQDALRKDGAVGAGTPGTGVGEAGDPAQTLRGSCPPAIAFAQNQREEVRDLGDLAGAVKIPGTHEQTFVATPLTGRPYADRGAADEGRLVVGVEPLRFDCDCGVFFYGEDETPCPACGGFSGSCTYPASRGGDEESERLWREGAPQAVDLYNQTLDPHTHAPLRTAGGHGAPAVMSLRTDATLKVGGDLAHTLTQPSPSGGGQPPAVLAFQERGREGGRSLETQDDLAYAMTAPKDGGRRNELNIAAPTLTATNDPSRSPQSEEVTRQVASVHAATMAVRRLTPRECERLMGFPDDFTAIPYGGKAAADCPDGPRYKALGNSMAVPVMRWIGERIDGVEEILRMAVRCDACGQEAKWTAPGTPCRAVRMDRELCKGVYR